MLDQETSDRIIEHMNDDHADAVLLYVQVFAGHADAETARLVEFDAQGMGIRYRGAGGAEAHCRIEFETPLQSGGDARKLLVDMVDQARASQGGRG